LIKGSDLSKYITNHKIITTPGVIYEIKDKRARERLQSLPYKFEQKMPTPKSQAISKYSILKMMFLVHNFALLTGDLSTLSEVDMNVIALCHTMIE